MGEHAENRKYFFTCVCRCTWITYRHQNLIGHVEQMKGMARGVCVCVCMCVCVCFILLKALSTNAVCLLSLQARVRVCVCVCVCVGGFSVWNPWALQG